MKRFLPTLLVGSLALSASAQSKSRTQSLTFDKRQGESAQLTMPDGRQVRYTAYTKLYYVTAVEDSTYQYLNLFVPEGATAQTPIFLRTYVGGYMASAAGFPQATDASGRALAEGYILAIPGSRGRNSQVAQGGKTRYTGRAPQGLLDLKAAVRYLRHFARAIPADAERIITDGTSAGGAMSSLLGATGNHPLYTPYLQAMGAAPERDDVFASIVYCPITDLEHADMAYEWLYGQTASRQSLPEAQQALSRSLADAFPAYQASLGLRLPDGTPLTAETYPAYLKQLLIASAQEAKDAGASIPDSLGFTFSEQASFQAPVNGGTSPARPMARPQRKQQGEYITDLDLQKYLDYVVSTQPLKGVPAFDSYQVAGAKGSGENELFGDDTGSLANFTPWSAKQAGATLSPRVLTAVQLMNPMPFIGDSTATTAPHWYIRHGARDRDTAFPVIVNLATKLTGEGKDVNFKLPWNRPHSGDYALGELFAWLRSITR